MAYLNCWRRGSIWIGRSLQIAFNVNAYVVALALIVAGNFGYVLALNTCLVWIVPITTLLYRPLYWILHMARVDQPWSGAVPWAVPLLDRAGCLDVLVITFLVALVGATSGLVGWDPMGLDLLLGCAALALVAMGEFIAAGPSLPPEDRARSLNPVETA